MGVEIDTYRGDGEDLADLIQRSWNHTYGGKSWFPLWDADYLRWRLLERTAAHRELVVVAHQAGKLVGCVISEPTALRVRGESLPGALTSYLSVDPHCTVRHLGLRLLDELRDRHRARGLRLALGVTNAKPGSEAKRFWEALGRRGPEVHCRFGGLTTWAVVGADGAVARAGLSTRERLAMRLGGWLPWGWTGRSGAAVYHDQSAPTAGDDLRLLRAAAERADIAMDWDSETAVRHLYHPRVFSFRHPLAPALLAGYLMPWRGRCDLQVALIDVIANGADDDALIELFIGAGRALRREGAQMIVVMDMGAAPRAALRRAGFLAVASQVDYFALLADPDLGLEPGMSVAVPFT